MNSNIILEKDAEEVGLAVMVADLIRQNIEAKPAKKKYLNKLGKNISINAVDAGVSITLKFNKGKLSISGKEEKSAHVKITTDSQTILDLSAIRIIAGIPWFFDSTGLKIVKKMLSGKLKIQGIFAHFLTILNLMKLFSVM
jgi:hypothetical protein